MLVHGVSSDVVLGVLSPPVTVTTRALIPLSDVGRVHKVLLTRLHYRTGSIKIIERNGYTVPQDA